MGRYSEGLAAAKENGKPIMVLFTQPWCGACKNLKAQLKTDSSAFLSVAEKLNVVSIEGEVLPLFLHQFSFLSAPQKISEEAALFTKDGGYIPRAYFLSPDGTPDYSISGPKYAFSFIP